MRQEAHTRPSGHIPSHIRDFVKEAVAEDLGRGDLYALLVDSPRHARAHIIAKQGGVFSGAMYLAALAEHFSLTLKGCLSDSESFAKGAVLCEIEGEDVALLQFERVALNILAHSSGIATLVASYMRELEGLDIRLLDTRKTRPLLRELEKYSVRNGGGCNHRFGLDSMLMLKDTHLAHIGDLRGIISTARRRVPFMCPIEVECESLARVKEAIEAGADVVMCDNMSVEEISEVVSYRNAHAPHITLEASGNITRENIRIYAQSGVDAISVGSLIHQATWLDLSMKMR